MIAQRARDLAAEKHKGQKYGEKDFTEHLVDVSYVLTRFGFGIKEWPYLHAVAYLHDILEDTHITHDEITMQFGMDLLRDVFCVTGQGKNRKERNKDISSKCRSNWKARIIKLADRIANVEASIRYNPELLKMYKKEQMEFFDAMYFGSDGLDVMWTHLNKILDAVNQDETMRELAVASANESF